MSCRCLVYCKVKFRQSVRHEPPAAFGSAGALLAKLHGQLRKIHSDGAILLHVGASQNSFHVLYELSLCRSDPVHDCVWIGCVNNDRSSLLNIKWYFVTFANDLNRREIKGVAHP